MVRFSTKTKRSASDKLVLDQAKKPFQHGPGRPPRVEQAKSRKIEQLQANLVQKNEVIAELTEDHIKLKKNLENSERSLG